ncbi:MAG: hypothetical protein ACRC33_21240 [Gemmataceae bacterium]
MTVDQLRATRDAVPFRPFLIHLTDGRAYRIPHRDYLSISPSGRTPSCTGRRMPTAPST